MGTKSQLIHLSKSMWYMAVVMLLIGTAIGGWAVKKWSDKTAVDNYKMFSGIVQQYYDGAQAVQDSTIKSVLETIDELDITTTMVVGGDTTIVVNNTEKINTIREKVVEMRENWEALRSPLKLQPVDRNGVAMSAGYANVDKDKWYGLMLQPIIGVGYSGYPARKGLRFDPYVGVKVAYIGRYGIHFGVTMELVGGGVAINLSDWVPLVKNTNVIGMYGVGYNGDDRVFIGIGVDL